MEKEIERLFSIELKSKANLKNVKMTNDGYDDVLVEGSIGKLLSAEFAEDIVLVVTGDKGILRINLTPEDVKTKPKGKEAQ
jgi:hypothetical protein